MDSMGVRVKFHRGSWWVFIHHRGRRRSKKIGDRASALRLAKELREQKARGDLNLGTADTGPTLAAFAAAWLLSAEGNLKASTLRFYRGHLDQHVLPAIGTVSVADLKRTHCRELAAACRAKALKLATVRGIVRTLSTLLSQAVEDELLPANPALRMGRYLRQGDEPKAAIQPLTREEAALLLSTAGVHFPRFYALLLCALRTGMRQGELLALRWSDIDFAGRFVAVNQNLVRGVVTSPKNHQRRRVDMSEQLAQELVALRRGQRAQAIEVGRPAPEIVFCSTTGTTIEEANLRHMFYRILEKAELRRIRFHDLRHTFASLLIQHGESLAYVRDQLGHKSIQITCDVYGHLVPGGNRAAVDRLDDASIRIPGASDPLKEVDADDAKLLKGSGEPRRNRTFNPQIKSLLLCQLS